MAMFTSVYRSQGEEELCLGEILHNRERGYEMDTYQPSLSPQGGVMVREGS